MPIKAVIFDLADVLQPIPERFKAVIKQYDGDPAGLVTAFGAETNRKNLKVFRELLSKIITGEIGEDDALKEFSKFTGVPVPKDQVKFWLSTFELPTKKDEAVYRLAEQLSARYDIAILSNTMPTHLEHGELPYLGSLPWKVFASFQLKCKKPEEKIYRLVADKLGIKPEEAVFVDDLQKNVDGAKKVGMKAILFKEAEQLEKELKALGLKF